MSIKEESEVPGANQPSGPYGPTGPNGRPYCDECDDKEMYDFAAQDGEYFVEGFSCDCCGWSFDTSRTPRTQA